VLVTVETFLRKGRLLQLLAGDRGQLLAQLLADGRLLEVEVLHPATVTVTRGLFGASAV